MRLARSLDKTIKDLKKTFHSNPDIIFRTVQCGDGTAAALVFLEGVCDKEAQRDALEALLRYSPHSTRDAADSILPNAGVSDVGDGDEAVRAILRGDTLVLVDGDPHAKALATAKWEHRAIAEPPTATVLRGPREGFTEDLKTDLTQMRRRLQSPDFVFELLTVGKLSGTQVAVLWIEGVADPRLVRKIRGRLKAIETDGVLDVNYLANWLEQHPMSIFPQTGTCEKPDVLTAMLLEGRIGILVNGSPIALSVPFLFFELFQQAEDYYTRARHGTFLRLLRLAALALGVVLPGLYVAVQVHHYTVIPLSYLYTLLNAVQGLPMSPLGEMVFVLIVFEVLHEASFRMPRYVGMAMSVVGALVLGDTAVKAGLISSPSIMIVALSAIMLYAVPSAVDFGELLRLAFVLLGGITGLLGMTLFGTAIVLHLATADSYGAPYLAPYAPLVRNDLQDGFVMRLPADMRLRPASFSALARVRRKARYPGGRS